MEDWFARRKMQREGKNVYLDIILTSVSSLHVLPQTCRDSLSGSSPLFSAACKLPFPQILRNDTHTNAPGVGWRRPSSTTCLLLREFFALCFQRLPTCFSRKPCAFTFIQKTPGGGPSRHADFSCLFWFVVIPNPVACFCRTAVRDLLLV